jgi:FlaA1/EpsC-like NDP-sugar epimerase
MNGIDANYNFSRVQTDSFHAPYPAQNPASPFSWAEVVGREPATSDPILIPSVAGQRVLVTGAGGFIGSAMVRVLAASGALQIILLEIAEQQLFAIFNELSQRGHADRCIPILGSVCDRALLTAVFDEHHPELVIHAAALKHVPLMERNPFAAVAANSIGTWLLAQIAAEHRARQMILISTDKAVAPHSIMGASKRIAELAMLAHPHFATVRLVNVIGSPGSVAPLFAAQIACGGPVTVTHPAASRFFVTLDEVVALLAQAIGDSPHGILVPDPGDPIRIRDLARRMIALSARRETQSRNIPIVFTEPRPGDKLDESLLSPSEEYAGNATPDLRRVVSPTIPSLDDAIRALESAVAARDLALLLELVERLVPDYQPSPLLRDTVAEFASR